MRRASFFIAFLGLLLSAGRPVEQVSPGAAADELFGKDDLLRITISGNLSELVKDKGSEPQYHDITLSYKNPDSSLVTLQIKAKTRGHFRRTMGNCSYPPIQLNFSKGEASQNSIFSEQDKVKLVMPCAGDKFVVREYLVYKLYNLLTPKSFRARLVKVKFEDSTKKKQAEPFFGILLEEESQVAGRNNAKSVDGKLFRPELMQRDDFLRVAVFEYLIGNTDWSIQYMQNIKLLETVTGTPPSPVPYDFDHAGIVGAPYAQPRPELELSGTRQRRYRGFCMNDMKAFDRVFAEYNNVKDGMSAVYSGCPYLDKGYVKSTLRYLDEFYQTINTPKMAKLDFEYPCQEGNTGNIIIKPLE